MAEQPQVEQSLKDSEKQYRSLFEYSPDAIFSVDLEGNFLEVNRACEDLLGYTNEELMGRCVKDFVVDEYLEEVTGYFEAACGGEAQTYETSFTAKDSGRRDVRVINIPIQAEETVVGVFWIADDVTKRVQDRKELEAFASKLEQNNRELQDFAYVSSHDLQEPLRKIRAFGDRLESKQGDALDEQGKKYLDRMLDAAFRMQTLINDLLAFSRVTTKAQPFSPVDLYSEVQGVVSDLERRIEETDGTVEVEDLPEIQAEPTQMRQLFQNLIGNALKFHREDTPPVVKVRGRYLEAEDTLPASSTTEEQFYEISVVDNGVGFEEKYADRIFAPFERLHGRSEYEGTGIGTAICRKIVERHRGEIRADSKPGEGSVFIVTLPVEQPEEEGN